LRTVGEVEILREGFMAPAAGVFDRRAPPEPGGAIEITKLSPAAAGGLFQHEMSVEQDGLKARQQ
jgi:hypothetical protein